MPARDGGATRSPEGPARAIPRMAGRFHGPAEEVLPMPPDPLTISHRLPPAVLAATVRSLAHRVAHLLADPTADPRTARVLLQRIACLASQLPPRPVEGRSRSMEDLDVTAEILA